MQKKLFFPKNLAIAFYCLGPTKFIVVTKNLKRFYLSIPTGIDCTKETNFLTFSLATTLPSSHNDVFHKFVTQASKWFNVFEKPLVKKLILKGLGLKATVVNSSTLELKLGLSHTLNIGIPSQLNVSIKKNIINVEGYDPVFIGNFLHKIRILKEPNIYKGKGIWYKNEIKVLKTVKKT